MKTSEIIYAVRERLKAYSDDSRFSDSYIYYALNLKRASFIRREYNNYQRNVDADVLQTIAMELEEVDESMAPEFAPLIDLDCTIIRTVKKVPPTIELHSKNTITRVGPVGLLDRPFQHVELNRFPHTGIGKYEKRFVFSTLFTDGKIYIKGLENYYRALDYITVTGLFENPSDVADFDFNGKVVFDYLNMQYPIEAWMADFVIEETVKYLINYQQIPADKQNDANDAND